LKERAQLDVDLGILPSCQYALALNGEIIANEVLGDASGDSRYAIWSATKPVFASLIWQLIADGTLKVKQPVADLWPEFATAGKQNVTLEHLLLFTAGFPSQAVSIEAVGDRDKVAREIAQWSLEWEPGTAWAYHPFSAHWVMAELVERTVGDYREALRGRVLDPLGLDRLELGVPEARQADIRSIVDGGEPATAEEVAAFLGLPRVPEALAAATQAAAASTASPNAGVQALQTPRVRAAGIPGGGGVSDASSLALFYQELLHNSAGVFDPAVLADVTANVRNKMVGPEMGVIAMRTLGLEVQGDDPTAVFRSGAGVASPRTFGHGGAGGQIAWADPASGLSFAYLTEGFDLHAVRQAKRTRELAAAAVAVVSD
jgi:CubicO group peptidase (beta-lactamase class C family)